MQKPLETLLSLPRVRLVNRVPIIETERMVRLYINQPNYRTVLVKRAVEVSKKSYIQFARDEAGLDHLKQEVATDQYYLTQRSKLSVSNLVNGVYGDTVVYEKFERRIEPLIPESKTLEKVTEITELQAGMTKEAAVDLAHLIGVRVPRAVEG